MNDPTSNPYAPPSVAETVYEPGDATLFVYRASSRSIWSIIGSIPIFLCAFVVTVNLFSLLTEPRPFAASIQEIMFGVGLAIVFLGFSAFAVAGFIAPRVWELKVNRQFVSWHMPWPNARAAQVQVSSIDRVEYHGNTLSIVSLDGERYYPPVQTYGGSIEPVITAITLAVKDREPQTAVRKRHGIESVSLVRRLGQLVGAVGRLFRKRR